MLGVFKNGPRGWANDWSELPVRDERDFDGLKACWMGEVQLPNGLVLTIKAINGKARISQDDLENTYDSRFEEAGQKACTFKP